MHRTLFLLAAAATGWLALSQPTMAASFDCKKASKPDEKAICSDKTLSALDSEMGALWSTFSQFPFAMGMSGVRQDEAQAFLAQRQRCGSNKACLKSAYLVRNASLKGQIKSAMEAMVQQSGGGPIAPSPTPGRSDVTKSVPSRQNALPDPVAAFVAGYGAQCSGLGGRLVNPGDVRILSGDVDDDGQPDYLMNTDKLNCDGAATAFCANAGCQIDVALSSAGYKKPVSLQGGVPGLVQDPNGVVVQMQVGRSNCDGASRQDMCVATYRWRHGGLKPSYVKQPQPAE